MTSRADWPVVRLEDVADDITVGHVGPMASEYVPIGIPFLRSQNVEPFRINLDDVKYVGEDFHARLAKSALFPGDVVIVRTGRPGSAAVVPPDLPVANCADLVIVRPGPKLDAHFLMYFVNSAGSAHVASQLVGAVQQHFNVGSARAMRIPLPPLSEQHRIARALGALDDKVDLNRRASRTLESMLRSVFVASFVDLDLTHDATDSEAGGPPPEIPDGLSVPPNLSTRGTMPGGWSIGTLGDIAVERRESVRPGDVDSDAPYIGLEHMPRRCIDLAEWGCASDVSSGKSRFHAGDILFGKLRPYFHKVGPAPVDGVCSTDIVVVRPMTSEWFGVVLGHLMSDAFISYATARSGGTRMPRTKWRDMAAYDVPLPPMGVVRAFNERVCPLVVAIQRNGRESRTLTGIRNALLPRLIGGFGLGAG